MSRSDLRAQRRLDLAFPLFNGASFRIDERHNEKEAVEKIDSMRIVKKIWPMQMYHPQRAISSPLPKMRRQSASNSTDTFSTHVMTGVDKLHAEGLSGKGKFIAIVDSGIDYNHPALGGGFGPGFKVAKGYDLVGDAYTGDNMPVPDSDPYTECSDHGTHVAGIIGANPNPYNFTGVAPGATLGMYRVFGCFDNVEDDVLIAAFMRAHEDGADVITASIGGNNGWTERKYIWLPRNPLYS